MTEDVELVEDWRGALRECVHRGHAVVVDGSGNIVEAWGDPAFVTYPRSSAKMIQALPLIESGAADAANLGTEQLALACASHKAADQHTSRVTDWLTALGLSEADLRCGPQEPGDRPARDALIRSGEEPCQIYNNCSGKHTGFLTLNRHLGGGPDYVAPDHPVQKAVRAAFEEVTGAASPCFGIDGCSAPNFAASLISVARAMASFAAAGQRGGSRAAAQVRLTEAMMKHPELISNDGEACTELMRACAGEAAVKGGADGYYVAILPGRGLGIALKISDGGEVAKEIAMAAILRRLGVLPEGAAIDRWVTPVQRNRRKLETGVIRPAAALA